MDASVALEHENGKGGSVNVIKTCPAALQSIIHVFVYTFTNLTPSIRVLMQCIPMYLSPRSLLSESPLYPLAVNGYREIGINKKKNSISFFIYIIKSYYNYFFSFLIGEEIIGLDMFGS
jgi:hypothetical protein